MGQRAAVLVGITALAYLGMGTPASAETSRTVPLGALDLSKMKQGYGEPTVDASVVGTSLSLAGRVFAEGVGTHATSTMWIDLAGGAERFEARVGVDDKAKGRGSVRFKVYGDGRRLWQSNVLSRGDTAEKVDVPLHGIETMLLKVDPADGGIRDDLANWADARFTVSSGTPKAVDPPVEPKGEILTPAPGPQPRLNNPVVYGCRPDNPFLYRIPATGVRPMKFRAEGLPPSIQLDAEKGILRGIAPAKGEYSVTFHAENPHGRASKAFKIVSGDKLSLTPYMGWNHWYMHYENITDELVRGAADSLIASGMADAGYDFVCIDDCWMNAPKHDDPKRVGPLRSADGTMTPNQHFPDMKALTNYIHARGLKAGIYSSPGPLTCGGFAGSYQHEAKDAETYAAWGFDLLKYDWCSYGKVAPKPTSVAEMQKPYQLMGDLLLKQKRDIIYNLCQYGMGNVWEWGADTHAQSWRTAGDLGYSLDAIFQVAARNAEHRAFNGPGSWNDPDYIQIGLIGDLKKDRQARRGVLTPTEEYAFMSMWCLSAAPLIYSGDMSTLDAFTTSILCNPEVIEVNQDPLGQCASVAYLTDETFLMIKEMSDGSIALGLCNASEFPARMTAAWPVLGITGKQRIRDLWRHKDLGEFSDEFAADVPRHGVSMVRLRAVE